ncbi:hypothetical protein C2S51_022543 [Perilla frutescens var. frutescens]|nr:hypothetical protein C2S51_022543 [Perilla frutescens var. frutescens]
MPRDAKLTSSIPPMPPSSPSLYPSPVINDGGSLISPSVTWIWLCNNTHESGLFFDESSNFGQSSFPGSPVIANMGSKT